MPTLAYDIDARPHAGRLTGRVLVGRRLSHGVVLADPGVSRLHAWVDPTADGTGWAVTDAGSKTGTTVNGQAVYRHDLRDGDVIRVGSTAITFRDGDDVPADAEPVRLTPEPGDAVRTSGVLFDCQCGAPIWVGNDLVGKRGRCRHCQRQIVVPQPAELATAATTAAAPPPPGDATTPPTIRRMQCGVCHAAIVAGAEAMTACPECETTYHAECWDENYGCSTYGCGHVNALNPSAPKPPPAPPVLIASDETPADDRSGDAASADGPGPTIAQPDADEPDAAQPDADPAYAADDDAGPTSTVANPWGWMPVFGAVLTSALGVVTFGVPALLMALVALVMLARRRPGTALLPLILALLIALVGGAGGLALSDYLFLAGRHLP